MLQATPLPPSSRERAGKRLGIAVVLLLGLVRAWIGRFSMNADGISYHDLADAFSRRDWQAFLNAYWSPVYPALLSIAHLFLPTSKRWELLDARILNFVIYAAALLSFEFFYASLRRSLAARSADANELTAQLPEWPLWLLAHGLFLWVSLDLITVWGVCPDLAVSAFVYLIAGLILRFRLDPSWKIAAILGVVLGASYWTKAVMFPLAFAFMVIALLCAPSLRVAAKRGLVLGATFAIVAGPLVAALSLQKHRFTFGDSGRINYAMFVSPGGATRNWQGEPALGIIAAHPTRQLLSDPPVYEFAEPIGGTFPPWYDPSYWEEGRVPRFSLKAQFATVARHLLAYADLLLHQQSALLAAFLALFLIARPGALRAVGANWPLLLLVAAPLGLYALVHVETRFIGAYIAVLWLALFSPLRLPDHLVRISGYLLLAVATTLVITVLANTAHVIHDGNPDSAVEQVVLSERLDAIGLHPGDRIAIVGGAGIYSARLSHLKIVAEVMGEDTRAFWRLTPEARDLVLRKFAESGARLVLAPAPAQRAEPSWTKLDGLPYLVHWL